MGRSEPGRLSHYELVEKIGEGGMGVVWRAHDTQLDRPVAIKILPEAIARDTRWRERFEREARTLAALNHPGIVTIYSIEDADGIRFITMELVRGRALTGEIPVGGLELDGFLDRAAELADAVAAAHEHGIVHRDLKPANVMVAADGRIKVLDFGLAHRQANERAERLTEEPAAAYDLSGTPAYMAPEQLRGALGDTRSDVFALGVMLHEMATGRHPFASRSVDETSAAILHQPAPDPVALRPDLPPAVGRLVRRCVEKDPALRPVSARELERELGELRRLRGAVRDAALPSIAVLPFLDLSPERSQAHLGDGLADELIDRLSHIPGLRVASRTASFRFRGGSVGPREIGIELGVDLLLEGSVAVSGGRLRVSAALTAAPDGMCRWSDRYQGRLADVFDVQERIAGSISQALRLSLSAPVTDAATRPITRNIDAYECYLRGRHFFTGYGRRAVLLALEMFQRAIDYDPDFALAHAGLADCHAFLHIHVDHHGEHRRRADEESRRALELDPNLAQCHVSRGLACSLAGEHPTAAGEFEAALSLNPRSFDAYYFYARDAFAQGLKEKAIELYGKAQAVRPEDWQCPLLVAQVYEDLGQVAEGEAARRRGVRLGETHLEHHPEDVRALYMTANGLAALGEVERALAFADRAHALDPEDSMMLYNVACVYALAGRIDQALDCLEHSVRAGLVHREWMESDSNLQNLRGQPRYRELLEWLEAGV